MALCLQVDHDGQNHLHGQVGPFPQVGSYPAAAVVAVVLAYGVQAFLVLAVQVVALACEAGLKNLQNKIMRQN